MSPSPTDSAPSERPHLAQKKKLAKELLKAVRDGQERAALRFTWNMDRFRGRTAVDVRQAGVALADAQHVIARESGFESWTKLKAYVTLLDEDPDGPASLFEQAVRATITGDTDSLSEMLTAHPGLAAMRSTRSHRGVLWHYVAANGVENEHQRTPANAVEIAELLLEHGGDQVIDATAGFYGGGGGSTPLVALVTSGHPAAAGVQAELVHLFCRAGANVDGIDDDGLPLASALAFRYPDAAAALADNGARIDNPVFAAALGRKELLETMLKQSTSDGPVRWHLANPFAHLSHHESPGIHAIFEQALVTAAMSGQTESVERLLRHGVVVDAAPRQSITALHEAAFSGHRDVVNLLLSHGARADIRDAQWGATAIGWADEGGHMEIADLLLNSRHVDLQDAIGRGRVDLVGSLLADDPRRANGTGESGAPLHLAAWKGNLAIIDLLLAAGADPGRKTAGGHSPLEIAQRAGHAEAAERLRRATLGDGESPE